MILQKLEKLDAFELTLRDLSSRLTRTDRVVERLKREARKMNLEINTMDAKLTTLMMKCPRCEVKLWQKKSRSINYT